MYQSFHRPVLDYSKFSEQCTTKAKNAMQYGQSLQPNANKRSPPVWCVEKSAGGGGFGSNIVTKLGESDLQNYLHIQEKCSMVFVSISWRASLSWNFSTRRLYRMYDGSKNWSNSTRVDEAMSETLSSLNGRSQHIIRGREASWNIFHVFCLEGKRITSVYLAHSNYIDSKASCWADSFSCVLRISVKNVNIKDTIASFYHVHVKTQKFPSPTSWEKWYHCPFARVSLQVPF